ncbi:MAG TPA: S16 family serine protease, partial [Candidatus Thermoplasmatota archaeon]|nr:S16 family serine protease [Candidatus Thermoplasmatota archaeon]
VGTTADVEATVLGGGSGEVYLSTKPLAQADFQASARLAAQVAGDALGVDWARQDYLVSFRSGSTLVGGPSAGASMALAFTAALHNLLHPDDPWELDGAVAATGTIHPDGTIGPVGGIPAKAEGAARAGIRTFLYPAGLEVAPAQRSTPQGVRIEPVDMARHCADLGLTCRSVATLPELLEAAAGVRLAVKHVDVPSTTGYAPLVAASVTGQVEALASRIERAAAGLQAARLPQASRTQVEGQAQEARDQLKAAQDALAGQRYYASATAAFKGAIAAGRAENLTRFYAAPSGTRDAVVASAIATCAASVQKAQDRVADLQPGGLNALYAVGAAQDRAQEAAGLLLQARAQDAQGLWADSLASSAFCAERSRTVAWWASLGDLFPPGPQVRDLRELAQATLDQAADLVGYAQAVLQGRAGDAQARLDQANAHAKAGRLPAAILAAAEAQSLASVAMQTGGGGEVPASVLAAAQQGAARAIDRARASGAEPMLAVSLVELAQDQGQRAVSLQHYWSARNLALLQLAPASQEAAATRLPSGPSEAALLAFAGAGVVAGVAAAALVVVAVTGRRAR